MYKLELLPCSDCGKIGHTVFIEQFNGVWQGVCRCGHTTLYCSTREDAIAAWNNLPRMSTIIAWQFQAAGLALENQRLSKIVDWLASWGDAHPCVLDMTCPFGSTYDACNLARDSAECWKEMARRAVEGE